MLLAACSSTQETTKTDDPSKEEIYVFDDPVTDVSIETDSTQTKPVEIKQDTLNFVRDEPVEISENIKPVTYYIVQVGAFTTKDKAEVFIRENQKDISYNIEVQYSSKVNLFVVWLPKFTTKEEAENVRNILWQIEKFKDAFIVIVD